MSDRDVDPATKLAKLNTSDGYILWKRRVYAYIRKSDDELLGFENQPLSNAAAARKKWFDLMMKAKSTIILCLGDSPLAKVRRLVDDDDFTAKILWNELETIYTALNAQSILNLRQELDDLRYEDGENWDDHVNKFMELLSKLATYDEELTEKEKASQLQRTLLESFSGFAMIAQVQDLELERLIQAMQAELSLRQNLKASFSTGEAHQASKTASNSKYNKGKKSSHFSGRISKDDNGCYVCGGNHFARDCWYKATGNEKGGKIRGGFRGNRGRGRGRGVYSQNQMYSRTLSQCFGHPSIRSQSNWRNSGGRASLPFGTMSSGATQPAHVNYQQFGQQENHHQASSHGMPFQGFMAKVKRSKLASLSAKKTDEALIDSGATHLFFHSKSYFKDYHRISEESVQSASRVSRIVGIGKILIPVDGGIHMDAYHAPEFGENILSVSKLSKYFTIQFQTDQYGDNSACFVTYKRSGRLVFKGDEVEGLYKMHVPKVKTEQFPALKSLNVQMSSPHDVPCTVCATANVVQSGNCRPTALLHDNKLL